MKKKTDLKKERKSARVSREDLSCESGYSSRTIAAWENGEWKPRPAVLHHVLMCLKKIKDKK